MESLSAARADIEGRHILSFSGGKDSTALGVYLIQNYPDIAERLELVFCDTGAELPETYDYIRKFETVMGVDVTFINALDMLGIGDKRGRTPFDVILQEYYGQFLPSPQMRWCTRILKIKPFEAYVGYDRAYSYIGIRAEENRLGYQKSGSGTSSQEQGTGSTKPIAISEKQNIIPVYPFKEDGLVLDDVKELLEDCGLGMPPYYKWRSRSGCYFCFYQQIGEWQGLKENHPKLFEKAKEYEKEEGGRKYTWAQGRSLDAVEKLEKRYEVPDGEDLDGCAICHL